MRLRPKIVLSILVTVLLVAAWQTMSIHSAERERRNREAAYAATASALQALIKPAMSRAHAGRILRSKSFAFINRSGSQTQDDLITLADEPSQHWYCSYEQVQVFIEFAPAEALQAQRPIPPAAYDSLPSDRVKSVALNHWPQDCL